MYPEHCILDFVVLLEADSTIISVSKKFVDVGLCIRRTRQDPSRNVL